MRESSASNPTKDALINFNTLEEHKIEACSKDDKFACFVCWEMSPRSGLIRPCKCTSDDLRFAHQECILRYLDLHHQQYRFKYPSEVPPIIERESSIHENTSYTFLTWNEWKNERVLPRMPDNTNSEQARLNLVHSLLTGFQFVLWAFYFVRFQISSPLERRLSRSVREKAQIKLSNHRCSVCKHPYNIIAQRISSSFQQTARPSNSHCDTYSHGRIWQNFGNFLKILVPIALLLYFIFCQLFPIEEGSIVKLRSDLLPTNTPIHISVKIESNGNAEEWDAAGLDIELRYPNAGQMVSDSTKIKPSFPQVLKPAQEYREKPYGYQIVNDPKIEIKLAPKQSWSELIDSILLDFFILILYCIFVVSASVLILIIWNSCDEAQQGRIDDPVMMEEGILRLEDGEVFVWTVKEYNTDDEK